MASNADAASLLMANVQTYIQVQKAFDECDNSIKEVVFDMLKICKDPASDNDEKERALATVVEALFPALAAETMANDRQSSHGALDS